jgi:rhodanese-related sulfurtransferase
MSPGAAREAAALGYSNVKVYHDGLPEWTKKNFTVLSPNFLKEAFLDKDIPLVILDVRPLGDAEKGFIKGAVSVSPVKVKEAVESLGKDLKPPIVVYDATGGETGEKVARELIADGYPNTKLLLGGYQGWTAAKLPAATGPLGTTVSYVPKPRPGEISVEAFQKLLEAIPADTVVIDVRDRDELKDGIIKGSLNIPADEMEKRFAELPKVRKIVAYCNTGTRAEMVYHTLKGKGVANIFFLNANVDFEQGKVEISK